MDDLISRQAAIEKLISNLTYMHTFGADRSIVLIEELPSAQPKDECEYWDSESSFCALHRPSAQPGWIPTSERLPEDNEEVLFCDNEGERWLGWHYGFWKTERLDFNEDEVVAWMPLPKPWEGVQDERSD